MANCSQTLAGIIRDCATAIGGVKAIFIANYADVASVTVSNDEVSAITMNSSAKFARYEFREQSAYANSDLQTDPVAGTSYWQTDIYMQFTKMETSKRIEINALAKVGAAVIVETEDGSRWYYGIDRPCYASAGNVNFGTAHGDRNGMSINIQANDNEAAPALASTVTIPE